MQGKQRTAENIGSTQRLRVEYQDSKRGCKERSICISLQINQGR